MELTFIPPKHRVTEANITAELYHQFKLAGIECYLEYKLDHCFFDVVVLKENIIKAAVEVKSYCQNRPINTHTKQFAKYLQIGLPIFWITRLEQIPKVLEEIRQFLAENRIEKNRIEKNRI